MTRYVAFLRGINVSGHHKVPMAELKAKMEEWGFHNPVTLLNSGNVIFDSEEGVIEKIESTLSENLTEYFGFPVPVMVRKAKSIQRLVARDPFKEVNITPDIRLYVSFLRQDTKIELDIPWSTKDGSYQIKDAIDSNVISMLDLAITKTTKGMNTLEKLFGKDVTTRNWNTILKVVAKLE